MKIADLRIAAVQNYLLCILVRVCTGVGLAAGTLADEAYLKWGRS